MANLLTDIGEEHFVKNGLQVSFDISTYNDGSNSPTITADSDVADISTEPSTGGAYARQSVTIGSTETASLTPGNDGSGDWGFSVTVTFDTSDVSQTVDSSFLVVNFLSEETGDASASDHLHSTPGPFSQSRDLSQIDSLDVTVEVTVA